MLGRATPLCGLARAPRARNCYAAASAREQPPLSLDAVLQAACDEAGVRFEETSAAEADEWEDDYLDVVADGESSGGFEAAVDGEPARSPFMALQNEPPPSSAYEGLAWLSPPEAASALASASPPLLVHVNAAPTNAAPAAASVEVLRVPLALLRDALASIPRSRHVVVLSPAGASRDGAAQAAVRLRRVLGFECVWLCDATGAQLAALLPDARAEA